MCRDIIFRFFPPKYVLANSLIAPPPDARRRSSPPWLTAKKKKEKEQDEEVEQKAKTDVKDAIRGGKLFRTME